MRELGREGWSEGGREGGSEGWSEGVREGGSEGGRERGGQTEEGGLFNNIPHTAVRLVTTVTQCTVFLRLNAALD